MPRESSLSSWLAKARRPGLTFLRIESTSVSGLPDVYLAFGGRSAWVELKVADKPATARGLVRPRFEPYQLPCQESLRRSGVPALVLVQVGRCRYLVDGGAAYQDRTLEELAAVSMVDPMVADPWRVVRAALL